jgi:hypothetical protein
MLIGQTISSETASGNTYYSPWIPRGGNAAIFVVDVIETADLQSFTITAQTKAVEDDDSAASAVGGAKTVTLTNDTRTSFPRGTGVTGGGFQDLVRFKYVIKQASSPSDLGYVHFRMLNPAWITD